MAALKGDVILFIPLARGVKRPVLGLVPIAAIAIDPAAAGDAGIPLIEDRAGRPLRRSRATQGFRGRQHETGTLHTLHAPALEVARQRILVFVGRIPW